MSTTFRLISRWRGERNSHYKLHVVEIGFDSRGHVVAQCIAEKVQPQPPQIPVSVVQPITDLTPVIDTKSSLAAILAAKRSHK